MAQECVRKVKKMKSVSVYSFVIVYEVIGFFQVQPSVQVYQVIGFFYFTCFSRVADSAYHSKNVHTYVCVSKPVA